MTNSDEIHLPGRRSDLERRITKWSKSIDLPESWLRKYIASSVIIGTDARLTRDFDAAFRGADNEMRHALELAFSEPLNGFSATVRELDPFRGDRLHADIYRYKVSLAFLGKPFSSVTLDMTAEEHVLSEAVAAIISLNPVNLPDLGPVTLICLQEQFAQKLHACTEPDQPDVPNDRVTDVYDLLLMARMIEDLTLWTDVRIACARIFVDRAGHSWPAFVTVRNGWKHQWQAMSRELPFVALGIPTTITEAVSRLNKSIKELLAT